MTKHIIGLYILSDYNGQDNISTLAKKKKVGL